MFVAIIVVSTFIFRQVKANYPDITILHAVVDGPLANIKQIDKDVLLYNLQFLQETETTRERKFVVFNRIKGDRRLDEMDFDEFLKLGIFVQGVPSYVLKKELDCNKVDIVSFLGKIGLRRKLLGVLAQCLKKEFGKQVYMNYGFINKFVGVICGYGVEELAQIDSDNFILINEEVFINLDECSMHQLKMLYEIAVRPTVYGIPQGWNKSVVRTLGTLLCITPLNDLLGMDPLAFTGVKPKVLRNLSTEKLEVLKLHLRYFGIHSKNEIWKMIGIPSGTKKWGFHPFVFMFSSLAFFRVSLCY